MCSNTADGGCRWLWLHWYTQEGLLDHRRLARHRTRPPRSLTTSPHRPGVESVTVMELQSQAVVQATGRTLSSTALTIPTGSVHLLPGVLLLHAGPLSTECSTRARALVSTSLCKSCTHTCSYSVLSVIARDVNQKVEADGKEGLGLLSLVKIAMSPLTLLNIVVRPAAESRHQATPTEKHV